MTNDDEKFRDYALLPVEPGSLLWCRFHFIARTALFQQSRSEYLRNEVDQPPFPAERTSLLLTFRGKAIGTVSLDDFGDGTAAIRMVAVRTRHQHQGHGRALGSLVERFAQNRGVQRLCVNAGHDAIGYYAALGFNETIWSALEAADCAGCATQMAKDL